MVNKDYQRALFVRSMFVSIGKLIYSGLATEYLDESVELLPFTTYEYKVLAVNAGGTTSSEWRIIRTAPSTPQYVPPPTVLVRTVDNLVVLLLLL